MAHTTPWIKATRSNGSNGCVELRRNGDSIEVRDSKNPTGPALMFTAGEWGAFTTGVRAGEFN